jgi:hypothetical protein
MNFSAPATLVVYEDDAADAATLLRGPGGYEAFDATGYPAYRVVPPWRQYHQRALGAPVSSHGTVFLHRRRSPGGRERLVAVDVSIHPDPFIPKVVTHAVVQTFEPVGVTAIVRGPTPSGARHYRMPHIIYENLDAGANTFYAGQPDPADASRFTIRVYNAQECLSLNGKLLDDGSVELTISGPPDMKMHAPGNVPPRPRRRP